MPNHHNTLWKLRKKKYTNKHDENNFNVNQHTYYIHNNRTYCFSYTSDEKNNIYDIFFFLVFGLEIDSNF